VGVKEGSLELSWEAEVRGIESKVKNGRHHQGSHGVKIDLVRMVVVCVEGMSKRFNFFPSILFRYVLVFQYWISMFVSYWVMQGRCLYLIG